MIAEPFCFSYSILCTEGYVPYGWQFRNEDVYIPSPKAQRVNIFGMIDRNNRYHGFTTTESIDVDKVVEYLDTFSLNIKKNTLIVLDNASVHRNKKIRELRELWEKRGLFLSGTTAIMGSLRLKVLTRTRSLNTLTPFP